MFHAVPESQTVESVATASVLSSGASGLLPFSSLQKASYLDIRPHGRFEVSMSKRPSIVQAFSETRSAYYALS